jgi:folate-binding protein YgfZ
MTTSVIHGKSASGQSDASAGTLKADFGDVRAEFEALISGCGVYDLSARAKIVLTGEDRVRWLNGMATNNIRDLASGHGVYAFLLNPQGRILADLYAYNRGDSLLLDTEQSQLEKILATFDHYIIMDDVEVTNASGQLASIGLSGAKAWEVARAAGIDLPQLELLEFVNLKWLDTPVTAVRSDNPAVESFELLVSPSEAEAVWALLVQAGARPVGANALELLRIASGIPRYGQDIRERDLPQETEQDRALNFTKGCYIGQEIVERIRSRGAVHRKFTGFLVDGPVPPPGTKIQSDGKDIGEITSSASLPLGTRELAVALGYVRREAVVPGKTLDAAGAALTLTNLPFTEVFTN